MKVIALSAKSITLFAATFSITISIVLLNRENPNPTKPDPMARSFVLWLHGLGDSGPANEPIRTFFTSGVFANTKWSFPSARSNPVTCNYGAVMPSWFDILEIPVTAESPKDEGSVLKAVQDVHAMIDKEIVAGTSPNNVFVCGFSQGGALTLASVLLYPKTLGGGALFSGWVPFNSSIWERVTPEAKQTCQFKSTCGGALFSGWVPFNSSIWERVTPEAKQTPILWSHGMVDRTVLFEAGQAGPPFLEKGGVSCEFKAYPGLGHSINDMELHDLESWIKSRLQSSS